MNEIEIKFRVWDEGRKQMWYRGSPSPDGNEIVLHLYASGIGWGLYDNRLGNRLVTGDPNAIFNTPGNLMQFTGLKDKNKKEIYAGDFVRQSGNLYEIRPCIGGFECQIWKEFKHEGAEEGSCYTFSCLTENCEVVGNIYQTPELLKK